MNTVHGASHPVDIRLAALRRFALAISVLTLVGHLILGFEMAYIHPFIALATAYTLELGLEWVDARLHGRPPMFMGGGVVRVIDFLLPGHITALACAMLLYTNQSFWPLVFAVAVGVGSKFIFRAPTGNGQTRHFLNPSNTGIAATVVVFPWIGVAPPYQFTNNLSAVWGWIVPGIIVCTGTFLNCKFTKKYPLILGWLGGFLAQAVLRSSVLDFRLLHALSPMTGMAFLLFTFYMITDPGTTPFKPRNQFIFGLSVAMVYMLCDIVNLVYQMFFALIAVCVVRGILLHVETWYTGWRVARAPAAMTVAAASPVMPEVIPINTSTSL